MLIGWSSIFNHHSCEAPNPPADADKHGRNVTVRRTQKVVKEYVKIQQLLIATVPFQVTANMLKKAAHSVYANYLMNLSEGYHSNAANPLMVSRHLLLVCNERAPVFLIPVKPNTQEMPFFEETNCS